MIHALIGQKKIQTQKFLVDGTRIPVTEISFSPTSIVAVKTFAKDGYDALQLGFGERKHPTKSLIGHTKGAAMKSAPQFLREVRLSDALDVPKIGDTVMTADVFKPGDTVDVIGVSKGKGYAGGVKRHGFKGGPRTHGQSDRERAPGSIGQTTTPGRVYKGKRMAGRMGHERVTVKNLSIVAVFPDAIWVKGLVPGGKDNLIYIKKIGEDKKFIPLIGEPKTEQSQDVIATSLDASRNDKEEVKEKQEQKEEKENAS